MTDHAKNTEQDVGIECLWCHKPTGSDEYLFCSQGCHVRHIAWEDGGDRGCEDLPI